MTLVARPAPAGTPIADSIEVFTDAMLDAMWDHPRTPVRALGAYLEVLAAHPGTLERYAARGYGVLLIGESRAPGWRPSAATGAADAAKHLALASRLGIPMGATIIDDFETPATDVPVADRIAHINGYAKPVGAALYLPAPYIGADAGLTSAEWQELPDVHRYGKSCSRIVDAAGNPIEPTRGYSWVQGQPPNLQVGGAQVDLGYLPHDYFGGAMVLVYDAAKAP